MSRKIKFGILVITSLMLLIVFNLNFIGRIITIVVSIVIWLIIFFNKEPFENKIAWLMIVPFEPIIGIVLYLTFGRNYKEVASYKKKKQNDQLFEQYEMYQKISGHVMHSLSAHERNILNILHTIGQTPITYQTNTDVLVNGKLTFEHLISAILEAQRFIHLEYFIVKDDKIGNVLKDALIRKANEGVEVRFMWDDAGCINLPEAYKQDLVRAGVKVAVFGDISIPFVDDRINFRNHRKIAIIDNRIGFTGGVNIGDEYMSTSGRFGTWRDTHLLIEGKALRSLHLTFIKDWFHVTKENILAFNPEYYLQTIPYIDHREGYAQIINSGPDVNSRVINDLYFKLISTAQKEILITTPYLIPPRDLLSALVTAAKVGVKIKIIIPGIPDKWFVYQASRSYYETLIEAGIEIYECQDSFIHSKILVVDGVVASVGTANFDMRSLFINFETTIILFRSISIEALFDLFNDYLSESRLVTLEEVKKRSIFRRTVEQFAQLFSPIL